jgi:branched-chain amino acid transport system ATP-binding protein
VSLKEKAFALELRNVSSGYGATQILRGLSLKVPTGSVTALLGANGAGKTTLLKTASGLIQPTEGQVVVNGDDVTRLAPNRRASLGMCHIPEGRGIFRSLTVRENLRLYAERGSEKEAIERACIALPVLGARLDQQAGTMSGGEQQMLAMARAYVQDPQLILVDEASLGLAPLIVDSIFEFLRKITDEGAALLIVDQFVTQALELAEYAYVMNRGTIVYEGTSTDLQGQDLLERYLGAEVSG